MDSFATLLAFWVFIALVVLFLLYDANRTRTDQWLRDNPPPHWEYPWFVKLDYWVYHVESARVQNVAFESHNFFGSRFRKLGEPITFIR